MAEPSSISTGVFLGGPGVDGPSQGPVDEVDDVWRQAISADLAASHAAGVGFLDDPNQLASYARRLGARDVFVRLSWARLMPREGELDEKMLRSYQDALRALTEHGLQAQLILSDGTLPAWSGAEGWLMPAIPERFCEYAVFVAKELRNFCTGIVTMEAPGEFACAGWLLGEAPPFRTAAGRDCLAALDGMLAAHLLASAKLAVETPELSRSMIPSSGMLGTLESALLVPDETDLPLVFSQWLVELGPGRAQALALAAPAPTITWVVLGRGPLPGDGLRLSMAQFGFGPDQIDVENLHEVLQHIQTTSSAPTYLALRSVVAHIDSLGRRSEVRGRQRQSDLADLLRVAQEHQLGHIRGVVVGELVDRWRWGGRSQREGLLGVDHLRGDGGVRLLATDAAGVTPQSLSLLHSE